ncbi:HDOD domain-containing protein [Variovorax sp. VNK109]|uniref:HDOD domain-containing protein n=1 Tax=Variovorax sp. VNK109 TaxID=3400919 RepID=UPI003BFBDB14
MQLEALLAQPGALPAAPAATAQLISGLDDPDIDTGTVAACISTDPVLTAKLLKQANSSFFWRGRTVGSVEDSLRILGLRKVRSLAIAMVMNQSFPSVSPDRLQQFWSYSLNTAELARRLAMEIDLDDGEAYTSGLIHAVGELPMRVGMSDAMDRLDSVCKPLALNRAEAQDAIFGYSYAHVGAELAKRWKFPWRIVNGVANHVRPYENDVYEPLAGVIHLAAWRARGIELNLRAKELITTYPDLVGEALGIDPDGILNYESGSEEFS